MGIDENNSTTLYGCSTVVLHSKINRKIIPITLHNVLFIPDAANPASISSREGPTEVIGIRPLSF